MNHITKIAIFSIMLFIALYTFILSVDPYDKFGFNLWHLKTKAVYSNRDTKFYHIDQLKNQYSFFILGSSRAQYINPDQINKLTNLKSYNYSVVSGQPEDYLVITKHILDKQIPNTILLYLDFKNLNKFNKRTKEFSDAKLVKYFDKNKIITEENRLLFFNKTYMTLTALTDSIRIIFINYFKKGTTQTIKKNGMQIKYHSPLYAVPKLQMSYFSKYYDSYTIDNDRISYLKQIKRLCDENKVKLIVSITPVSKEHLNKILKDVNLRNMFFEFKRIITSIFGEAYDFNNYDVVKYDGFHWIDSVHVTEDFARIITNRTLSKKQHNDKFGYKLKKENIESYIENFDSFKLK